MLGEERIRIASQLFFISVTTTLLIIFVSIMRRLRSSRALKDKKPEHLGPTSSSPEPTMLCKSLASALPDSVIFSHDATSFKQSMNCHWAQQECEVIPACVVRPRDVQQLCAAVTVLKHEYDERGKQAGAEKAQGLFAIRSGGHSPIAGAASIEGGVVIDLSLFSEVTPSEDGSSVVIGAGAKWMDVYKVLDEKGLAVVGGRNSAVGVGGLTLGGEFLLLRLYSPFPPSLRLRVETLRLLLEALLFLCSKADTEAQPGGLSFFSPRFGLVCSNVLSYEVVLASGCVTTASASANPDLWRALKGGSNNFGIVTRFTCRSFPSTKIWSGFLYMPASQTAKVLAAFHEFVNGADSGNHRTTYDNHAAGPMACFSYVEKIGVQLIAVNVVYTKPPEDKKKWPACWEKSRFRSLWRFWSTCKVHTLTSASDEMNALNPPGRRQIFASTTIKNDPATLAATHAAYRDAIASLRHFRVKGLLWTLVMQPLRLDWVRKGDANLLGLDDGTDEVLVIVSFTANWDKRLDDELVKTTTRRTIEQIDAVAAAKGTGHRYRFMNYCAEWQRPFEGYGVENWRFLQSVSKRYDPEGLFQRGCSGGFKLGVVDDKA